MTWDPRILKSSLQPDLQEAWERVRDLRAENARLREGLREIRQLIAIARPAPLSIEGQYCAEIDAIARKVIPEEQT